MSDYLPFITLGLTVVVGVISFFIKRELDNKDKDIARLEERVKLIETRVQSQEIVQEKLSGKIDLIIELLERLEKKIDSDETRGYN